jgi:protein gp37
VARALCFADNIWIATSIESMVVAHRADALREIDASVRFISAEPLLGPLDQLNLAGVHWLMNVGTRPTSPDIPRRRNAESSAYLIASLDRREERRHLLAPDKDPRLLAS